MRKTVLIVGAGHVGLRVIALLNGHARVLALTRQAQRQAALRQAGAIPIAGDLDRPHRLRALARHTVDAIIHLAPPPGSGRHDPRMRHLLAAIVPKHAQRFAFVYVSTTGVYGDCGGAWVDEARRPNAQSDRAHRRADAERRLYRHARRHAWRATVLRAPGIYDADRLPIARLRARTPALIASEDTYTNHVHTDDLARMCVAALRSRRGWRIYHACDDTVLPMGDYFDLVADTLGLPRPPRLSKVQVMAQAAPLNWSFMRESRRLSNARIKRELNFRLRYPKVHDFLATLASPLRRTQT